MKHWIINFILFALFIFLTYKGFTLPVIDPEPASGFKTGADLMFALSSIVAVVLFFRIMWWIHDRKPQIHDWFEKWF